MGLSSRPIVNSQLIAAGQFETFSERHDLLVGQMTVAATATTGVLYLDIQTLTNAEIFALFGYRSELTQRIINYLDVTDRIVRLSVIPLEDPTIGADNALAAVDFAGTTATKSGYITISVFDAYIYSVTIPVNVNDTPSGIAESFVTAFGLKANCPATSVQATGSINFTAANKGVVGNLYGIKVSQSGAAGITYSIDEFAGGLGNPTLTGIFDVISDIRFTGIGWPEAWIENVGIMTDFLASKFDAYNSISDGVGFVGLSDTYTDNMDFVEAKNSPYLVVGGNSKVDLDWHKGPIILKHADCVMSAFMGIRSKRLTEGALIGREIIAQNGILDNVGGPSLASLPYFNTADIRAVVPDDVTRTYSNTEEIALIEAGFTPYGINRAGNQIIFRDVVTTYKTDLAGNPNDSFKYLNYVDTGSVCREILFNSAKARFAQTRLTTGSLIDGRNIVNAEAIKGHYMQVIRELGNLALLAAGPDAEKEMSDNTIVTIDTANRSATVSGPIILVTQLGKITYNLQFQFGTASA